MSVPPSAPPDPPRWSRALLARILPPVDADTVLGDLEEDFHRRAAGHGPRKARRWYRREALSYLVRAGRLHARRPFAILGSPDMLRDIRLALRGLLRRPGFTLVVATTLALGIGANATIFSVVDAVLFRPLPVHDADRLVEIFGSSERDGEAGGMFQGYLPLSYPNFDDMRDAATTVDGMYVHSQWPVSVGADDEAERVDALYVSASFFDVLGVRAALGRTFRPDEDLHPGADAVVVLRHGYWTRRFASDPGVIGRTITVNARPMEVVGVAPPGFRGPRTTLQPDLFVPVSMVGDVPPWGPLWTLRGLRFFFVGARIAPGRTPADVQAEMSALAGRLAETYPEDNRNAGARVLPLAEAKAGPNQSALLTRTGGVLLAMAGLVLLIACMNVANLLLVRGLARQAEMAVRTSLGATRGRLARELLVESGLLFALGAGLGVAGAVAALGALGDIRPPALGGGSLDVALDLRVLGFTVALTLASAALFGAGPAVRAARAPGSALRSRGSGTGRGAGWARDALVLGQVALSVVALSGAGLFLRSLAEARSLDPGFQARDLGMLQVDLAAQGYSDAEGRVFYRRMAEEAEALPSVVSAAVGSLRPLAPGPLRRAARVDEDRTAADAGHFVRVELVSPGFFETLGIDRVRGRGFEPADREGAPLVAVANGRMADLMWPGDEPLGQRLTLSLVDGPIEVVGLTATGPTVSLSEDPQPVLYLPLEQHHPPSATLFVRTRSAGGLEAARRATEALDPTLPVFGITTAEGVLAEALWTARATARVLALFGLVGLFLAAVGIYGVVAHSVRERTREMGLRIALGADHTSVLRAAVGRTLAVAGLGAALGAGAAALAAGAFGDLLVGAGGTDPATLGAVVAGLLLVAGLAAFFPARRATRVDPMVVLRGD